MPVLCATVSSLPSPNIFRYQLVSISLISAALCLCCAPCFPDEEPRLASWELLRWALAPLRDATDCLRSAWCGWCPPPGPPTPPPLLRAASMAPEGAPLPSRAEFREQAEEEELQVSKSLRVLLCWLITPAPENDARLRKACFDPDLSTFYPSSAVLKLNTFAAFLSVSFSPLSVCLSVCLSLSLCVCVFLSFCLCSVLSGLL